MDRIVLAIARRNRSQPTEAFEREQSPNSPCRNTNLNWRFASWLCSGRPIGLKALLRNRGCTKMGLNSRILARTRLTRRSDRDERGRDFREFSLKDWPGSSFLRKLPTSSRLRRIFVKAFRNVSGPKFIVGTASPRVLQDVIAAKSYQLYWFNCSCFPSFTISF
jgi:hypothetical protein